MGPTQFLQLTQLLTDTKHRDAGELLGLFSQPPMLVAGTHTANTQQLLPQTAFLFLPGKLHNCSLQPQPWLQGSLTPFAQVTTGTLHGPHHPDITHKLHEMPSQLCAHTPVYICLFPPRLEQLLLSLLKQQGPSSGGQGCSGHCLPSPGLHSLGTWKCCCTSWEQLCCQD